MAVSPQKYALLLLFLGHFKAYEGKANPIQSWIDPEGSRTLRFSDFRTIGI
jgi:hypothetical protein